MKAFPFFIALCVTLGTVSIFLRNRKENPRQLTRLEAPREQKKLSVVSIPQPDFKMFPGVLMIGYRAGDDVSTSDVSHVFVGPMAGTGYKINSERPLVEFRNKSGEIMFTIDRNGKYKRNITEEEIVKEFENYDFQGREYMRKNPRPELPMFETGSGNYEGIVD